ncbi:MAG: SpoIIIAH-like family protein [Bacilli bacterium]|nr:SpoIIIAH-like family protein [Bacilli bacterium]
MVKKQNLWFITLFSLILVLSVYYLSMKKENLDDLTVMKDSATINTVENSYLVSLRVSDDEALLKTMEELEATLNDNTKSTIEKNEAYETLKELNINKGKEMELEKLIKEKFDLNSYVKISGDKINITIASDTHSKELANKIINEVQNRYEMQKYITVKFKK